MKAKAVYASYEPPRAEDVAEAVFFTNSMPAHVNASELAQMPNVQGFAPQVFWRRE